MNYYESPFHATETKKEADKLLRETEVMIEERDLAEQQRNKSWVFNPKSYTDLLILYQPKKVTNHAEYSELVKNIDKLTNCINLTKEEDKLLELLIVIETAYLEDSRIEDQLLDTEYQLD